jgi:hypothetical protein
MVVTIREIFQLRQKIEKQMLAGCSMAKTKAFYERLRARINVIDVDGSIQEDSQEAIDQEYQVKKILLMAVPVLLDMGVSFLIHQAIGSAIDGKFNQLISTRLGAGVTAATVVALGVANKYLSLRGFQRNIESGNPFAIAHGTWALYQTFKPFGIRIPLLGSF